MPSYLIAEMTAGREGPSPLRSLATDHAPKEGPSQIVRSTRRRSWHDDCTNGSGRLPPTPHSARPPGGRQPTTGASAPFGVSLAALGDCPRLAAVRAWIGGRLNGTVGLKKEGGGGGAGVPAVRREALHTYRPPPAPQPGRLARTYALGLGETGSPSAVTSSNLLPCCM